MSLGYRSLVFNCCLKTLTFHKIVWRHNWCVVGSLAIFLLHIFSWFWQCNKFYNRSIFDDLSAYTKTCANWFWPPRICWQFGSGAPYREQVRADAGALKRRVWRQWRRLWQQAERHRLDPTLLRWGCRTRGHCLPASDLYINTRIARHCYGCR